MTGYRLAIITVASAGVIFQLLVSWRHQGDRAQPLKSMLPTGGTSVHCRGNTTSDRFCHFHNMCYSHLHDEFIFVHGPQSEIVAVPDQRYEPNLALQTSSYDNTANFHYIDVTHEYLSDISPPTFSYKLGKYFLYSRVTPGNLMHVFHDELLPIFFTFLRHNELQDKSKVRLIANDEGTSLAHPYPFLYKMFTDHDPLYISELEITDLGNDLTCFEDLYVGLVGESMWKRNRFILNGKQLERSISEIFKIPVIEMSLEQNSLQDIIAKISCAKIAVGVHGAILVLTMFLPRSSLLLEIFPYAINPDHRRHYRTLVELEGMNIEYVSWRNMDRSKSLGHPNNHQQFGGIIHLSKEEQDKILRSTEVAHHKVSKNPEWRFYLYQDTNVDINAVIDLLKKTNIFKHRQQLHLEN